MPVIDYQIEELTAPDTWAIVGTVGSDDNIGVALSLTPGVLTTLRVVAVNAVADGVGAPSEPIELTPAALPGPSASIFVAEYGENYLLLEWDVPADTGAGDQSLQIVSYELQVDEGFGSGFVAITGEEQTTTQFKHENLI